MAAPKFLAAKVTCPDCGPVMLDSCWLTVILDTGAWQPFAAYRCSHCARSGTTRWLTPDEARLLIEGGAEVRSLAAPRLSRRPALGPLTEAEADSFADAVRAGVDLAEIGGRA